MKAMVAVLLCGVGVGTGVEVGVGTGVEVGVGTGVEVGVGEGEGVGATIIFSVSASSLRSFISSAHATTAVKTTNVTNACAIIDFN